MKEIMIKTIKYWENTEVNIYPNWPEKGRYKIFLANWEVGELTNHILNKLKTPKKTQEKELDI